MMLGRVITVSLILDDDGDDGVDDDDDHRVLDISLHQLLSWPHTLVITPRNGELRIVK